MGEVIASLFSHAKGRLRKHPGDWLVSNERRHHRSRDVRPNVARPPAGTGRVRVMFLALLVVLFVPSRLIALTHGAGVARVLGVVAERSGITVRGNVVEFASSYSKNQYDASMRRLRQLENRVEMLEQAIGQSSRDDLAKLTQR